jgi:septum formation protein
VRLILASASPRRADLLRTAGFTFDVVTADVCEAPRRGESPVGYVVRLAGEKAMAVARRHTGATVIGADTAVVLGRELMGKPASDEEAARMLRSLSGGWHEVLTGVAICTAGDIAHDVETTRVRFRNLDAAEVAWYVASGEGRDKAGAYAIQGLASRFVDRIDGSYSNVVGLPVSLVWTLLKRLGWTVAAADPPH